MKSPSQYVLIHRLFLVVSFCVFKPVSKNSEVQEEKEEFEKRGRPRIKMMATQFLDRVTRRILSVF